ncbi:MAG: hypothetical protein HPY57_08315 [Ignavibacteria bacterium]|nr:hypothetical protein [Ignavibacteria bacterium]
MNNKKTSSLILILLFTQYSIAQFKLSSISFYTDYSYPLKKRLLVTKIDAVGGGAEISFSIHKNIELSFSGGYSLFSLQQDSAIQQWNWRFYTERYAGIIRDNLRADSTLAAYLNPIQKMDLVPFQVSLKGNFQPIKNIYIKPQIGAGVYFYTRRLYLEETWRKRFDEANYTFEYSYRNFATNKYGNPIGVFGSIEFDYQPSEIFSVGTSFGYNYFIKTIGKMGFDQFPIDDYFNFKIYLTFLY